VADRFDKFTDRARRALQAAQEEAVRLGHGQITAEHLLLGVIHDPTAVATQALQRLQVNVDELARSAASAASQPTQESSGGLSSSARKVIQLAVDEARALDHHYVGTEHLLLGLVREGANALAETLRSRPDALQRTRAAIVAILNDPNPRSQTTPGTVARSAASSHSGGLDTPPDERERLFRHVSAFLTDPTTGPAESEAGLFARLADAALLVLQHAHEEALRFSHNYIGTEHVLLGLVRDPESGAGRLLADLGADLHKMRNAVEFIIGRGDRPHAATPALTPRAQKVILFALDESDRSGHTQAGSEHLLLGIIREGEGIASGVLESLAVNPDRIRAQMLEKLGQPQVPPTPARVSRDGREALLQAQLVARWYYHPHVDTEHLLVGLMRARGVAARVLDDLGVQLPAVLERFEALAPAATGQPTAGGLGHTLAAQAAIERASWEADQRSQARAGSGHLLLGVLAIEGGHARDILQRVGASPEAIRQAVEPLLADDADS
jgi:ATP-dependent Clp protease ATP-binding subunit ClpA